MKRSSLLIMATTIVLLISSGVALAAARTDCGFSSPTDYCEGGADPDLLYGTSYQDYINGKGGSDILYGQRALNGSNWLYGDDYYGDPSKDGDDKLYGGPDQDVLEWGFGGNDVYKGGKGRDTISAVEADIYEDTDGNTQDVLRPVTDPGEDTVEGGGGNDWVNAKDGYKDRVDCGSGRRDQVRFDEGLDEVRNCEIKLS